MTSAEQVVSRILRDVPQAIWVVDAAGCISFANPAAVTALGYSDQAEFLGKGSHATVHHRPPDRPAGDDCVLLAPRLTGCAAHGEDEFFIRRDGSLFPIAWWSSPIDLPSGRGVVVAFTDITERQRVEAAARERDAATIRAVEAQAAQRRIMERTVEVRRRVARDLHDGAQQRLVALLLHLELARTEAANDDSPLRTLLDGAVAEAQGAIDDLRGLAAGLHPSTLQRFGLTAAIQGLADRVRLASRIDSSLTRRLASAVEASAYFAVAEAMTNAVKHAHATGVTIAVRLDDDMLDVEVSDDGIGGAIIGAGSGLVGLVDRIGAHHGTVDVTSPCGVGTTVRIRIPLDAEDRRAEAVVPRRSRQREV